MTNRTRAVDWQHLFATFPERSTAANALALTGGAAAALLGATVGSLATGSVGASASAGLAAGVYYAVLYTRAVGGPAWNVVLPGFVAPLVLLAAPSVLPDGHVGELDEAVAAFTGFTSGLVVAGIWHRHLGDAQYEWATEHYPERLAGLVERAYA